MTSMLALHTQKKNIIPISNVLPDKRHIKHVHM